MRADRGDEGGGLDRVSRTAPAKGWRMARFIRASCIGGVAAGSAVLLTYMVSPMIDPVRSPLLLAAVVVSAWYGGLGAGLVTSAIAGLTKMYFILPPLGFRIDEITDFLHLLVFALVAVLISTLTGALKRADAVKRVLIANEQAARAEAEAANRAKDVFLAKISHELRTPLQAASSCAHVLADVRHDDRAFATALARLHRGLTAQSHLIDDLLAASRIIGGKMRLTTEPVMLAPIIEAAAETAKAAARHPHPFLSVDVDPSAGPVLGDRARLEQVVCNLVSNALKFTPADGRIDIRLARAGDRARIVVADTGRGIPAETLSHVFDEFWQARGADAGSPAGLGLGLAIARQLVEMHGGTIHADSKGAGLGATFVVELPLLHAYRSETPLTLGGLR
jgi:signal transduction histidine kinase